MKYVKTFWLTPGQSILLEEDNESERFDLCVLHSNNEVVLYYESENDRWIEADLIHLAIEMDRGEYVPNIEDFNIHNDSVFDHLDDSIEYIEIEGI